MSDRTGTAVDFTGASPSSAGTFGIGTSVVAPTSRFRGAQGTTLRAEEDLAADRSTEVAARPRARSQPAARPIDRALIDQAVTELRKKPTDEYEQTIQIQNVRGIRAALVSELAGHTSNTSQMIVMIDSILSQIISAGAVDDDGRALAIEGLESLRLPFIPEASIDTLADRMDDLGFTLIP